MLNQNRATLHTQGLAMLLLATALSASAQEWPNIHLVDHVSQEGQAVQTRALFRAAELGRNGTAQVSTFLQTMRKRALAAGLYWPEDDSEVYVRDISLVNFQSVEDATELGIEFSYWSTHKDDGELVFWQTVGTSTTTSSYANVSNQPVLRSFLVRTLDDWQADRLPSRTDWLRAYLFENPRDLPRGKKAVATVVHCIGGKDRTGEMIGSYQLKYSHLSYKTVLEIAYEYAGRPIGSNQQTALQWYCFYLASFEEYKHLDCSLTRP